VRAIGMVGKSVQIGEGVMEKELRGTRCSVSISKKIKIDKEKKE
jgi:hypothetical protein